VANLEDPRFRPYFRAGRGVTTWLQLMETYCVLLRNGKTVAEAGEVTSSFEGHLLDFSFRDVQAAMTLRLAWHRRRKRISYVDALGYHLARERGLKFLTGDPEFRGAPGVTFMRIGR